MTTSNDEGHIEILYENSETGVCSEEVFQLDHFKQKEASASSGRSKLNINSTNLPTKKRSFFIRRLEIIIFNSEHLVDIAVDCYFIKEIHLRGWNINSFRFSPNSKDPSSEDNIIEYIDVEGSNVKFIKCTYLPPYTSIKLNESPTPEVVILSNVVNILNLKEVFEENPDLKVRLRSTEDNRFSSDLGLARGGEFQMP